MLSALAAWVLVGFDEAAYVWGLKVGGLVCGAAEVCVLLFMLKIIARITGRPVSKPQYAMIAAFFGCMALMLLPRDAGEAFLYTFAVFAVPYIATVIRHWRTVWNYLKERVREEKKPTA